MALKKIYIEIIEENRGKISVSTEYFNVITFIFYVMTNKKGVITNKKGLMTGI